MEDGTSALHKDADLDFEQVGPHQMAVFAPAVPHFVTSQWFIAQGGLHPRMQFPSRETVGGVRGTVTTESIPVSVWSLSV